MKLNLSLSGKQLAAGGALLLGVVLAFGSVISNGAAAGPVDAAAIADIMAAKTDHVTAPELARWLIEKRDDFQLIDIRDPWKYDDYHIPTAINIPLTQLFHPDGLKQLDRSKTIVVYGLGAGHSAQSQLLLSLKGYRSLSLLAGISAWWEQVMTPQSLWSEDQTPQGYRQTREIRNHFMGGPSGGQAATTTAAPAVPPPPAATQKEKAPVRKKLNLGRGCS